MTDSPAMGGMSSGKSPSGRYPAGRTCAKEGCKTTLSRYNPGKYCSTHERSPREKLLPPPVRDT